MCVCQFVGLAMQTSNSNRHVLQASLALSKHVLHACIVGIDGMLLEVRCLTAHNVAQWMLS